MDRDETLPMERELVQERTPRVVFPPEPPIGGGVEAVEVPAAPVGVVAEGRSEPPGRSRSRGGRHGQGRARSAPRGREGSEERSRSPQR